MGFPEAKIEIFVGFPETKIEIFVGFPEAKIEIFVGFPEAKIPMLRNSGSQSKWKLRDVDHPRLAF